MGDQPRGDHEQNTPEDSVDESFPPREFEIPPALGSHEAGGADSANDSGDAHRNPSRNFLRRLTISEWLTFLVGSGSLAVAILTWRTISDTSDIKSAIRNLSDLAVQTERQADAASGQLAEMREEQRPWLQVIPAIKGPLANEDGNLSINIGLDIKNTGHAPAVSVRAKAELRYQLFFKYEVGDDPLKSICKSEPNKSWKKLFFEDPGYDIVFPGESDVVEVSAATEINQGMPFKNELWDFRAKGIGKSLAVNLVFCVAYKEVDGDDIRHTGGVISISVPDGSLKDGSSVPAASLNLERAPFEWRNYAD